MGGRRQLLPLLAFLASLAGADGKLQTGTVLLAADGDGQWQFLSKFGYAIGTGSYDLRLRLRPSASGTVLPRVDLDVYLDEEWDRARSLPVCRRSAEAPSRIKHHRVGLGGAGHWGPWQSSTVHQAVRTHIWYFALSDCSGPRPAYSLDYEVRFLQFDGSELSFEHRLLPAVDLAALALLTGFAWRLAGKCGAMRRRTGSLHPVVQGLGAAVALQWLAQALHVLHLWTLRWDGVGLGRCDALSGVLFMLSQVTSGTLVLAISRGYTLLPSRAGEWRRLRPLAAALATLHVLLVCLGRLQGETADTHHEHSGSLGAALLLARVLLQAWFVGGVRELRAKGGFRLAPFVDRFQLAGSAYLLAFPAIWAVAQLLAQYLRHLVMHVGLLGMQTAAAFWLAELFLSRGGYFEVSELSAPLLPGADRSPLSCKKAD